MYSLSDRIFDFSTVWSKAAQIFPYFDKCSIDWDEQFHAYLSSVASANTETEFHLLTAEFLNLLGDGHTDYTPPLALRSLHGHLPFSLRLIEDTYCIDAAIPSCQHLLHQPVLSINDVPFEQLLSSLFRYCYHVGRYIPDFRLHQFLPLLLKSSGNTLKTPSGTYSFDLLHERPDSLSPSPLLLPVPYRSISAGKLDIRVYENNILYVRLDDFMYPAAKDELRAAITQTPDLAGVILDIRENIGGMTMNGAEIAKLLIPGEFHACHKRTRSMTGIGLSSASQLKNWTEEMIREHIAAGHSTREEIDESLSFISRTHYNRYTDTYGAPNHAALFTGPCVLLTSRCTLSAAEDFTAMFKTNKRAVIIGAPTSGTTGTPYMQRLHCGGLLRICSVGYQLLDGTEFIGRGIEPDISCEINLEAYQRNRDFVLDQALSHIKTML